MGSRLCIPGEFPWNPREFRERAFEIWGIRRNVVLFSAGTNIQRSTDGAGTSKKKFLFLSKKIY